MLKRVINHWSYTVCGERTDIYMIKKNCEVVYAHRPPFHSEVSHKLTVDEAIKRTKMQ